MQKEKSVKEQIEREVLLFPRLRIWKNKEQYVPMSFIKTIKTEKRTLQNIVLLIIIIYIRYYIK